MRGRAGSFVRSCGLVGVIALSAVACTGGASSIKSSAGGGNSIGHGPGGPIVGAEGWPQCLNPITDCSLSPWYRYTVQALVLPRLVQWSNRMEPQPSPLITEVPSLDNGGLTQDPFTVTYNLNPSAVWSDGTPITCDDVDFTWKAILNSAQYFSFVSPDGELGISRVDCSRPRTVKLEFNKVDVDWPDLFGGASGFILEKAAFRSVQGFPDKPDLKSEMNDSLSFSGGPWILKSWSPNQALLVRNDAYWGQQPYLDQVTFVPRTDQATEVGSILSGDVAAIAPQATNVPFASQFGKHPYVSAVGGNSNSIEALWFQMDRPPMNDLRVREAFAYAMDRESVVKGVIALNNPEATVNDCGPWIPGQGPWCAATGPFARYRYDPAVAISLLEQAGYDCSKVASGGFCEKRGRPITITIAVNAGDVQDGTTVSLLQGKAQAAGIDIQMRTYSPPDLFSNVAPKGDFQVALYSRGPITDPTVTQIFSCAQIPRKVNGYGGGNFDHWCNRDADRLMAQSEQELDVTRRAQDIQAIGELLATDLPMLPLDVLPSVAAWRTDKIAGVDPSSLSSPYGFYFGMTSWRET